MAILISEKADFRAKNITSNKEYNIMTKVQTHIEGITILSDNAVITELQNT